MYVCTLYVTYESGESHKARCIQSMSGDNDIGIWLNIGGKQLNGLLTKQD